MTLDYQISIKAKNPIWYEAVKDYPSVEAWEKWDNEKTARYIREMTFKFKINAESFRAFEHATKQIICVDEKQNPVPIPLPDIRVIKFYGEIVCDLIVSESIIDQFIIEKKENGKTYFNCYIKPDAEFQDMSENIWLSYEHIDIIKKTFPESCNFLTPAVEMINYKGIIPIHHDTD